MFLGCHLEFGESFGSPGRILVPPQTTQSGDRDPEILSIDKSLQVTPGHMNKESTASSPQKASSELLGQQAELTHLDPQPGAGFQGSQPNYGPPLLPQCLICVGKGFSRVSEALKFVTSYRLPPDGVFSCARNLPRAQNHGSTQYSQREGRGVMQPRH